MSKRVNDHAIDDVIQGIKETLHRHSASFRSDISRSSRNPTPERSRELNLKIGSLESSRIGKSDNYDITSSHRFSSPPRSFEFGWQSRPESISQTPIISPERSLTNETFQKYLNSGPRSPLSTDSIKVLTSRLETIPSPTNAKLEVTFKEQSQEIHHLSLIKDQLANELDEANHQLSDLRNTKDKHINELIAKLQDALHMNENLRKEKSSIEQDLNSFRNNLNEIGNIKSSARELERRANTLNSDNKNLADENLNLKQKIKMLETEVNYKDTKIANLSEEVGNLKQKNNQLEDEVLNFKREQFSVQKENEDMRRKVKELENVIEGNKRETRDMEDRINNMKDLLKESAEVRYLGKAFERTPTKENKFDDRIKKADIDSKNSTSRLFNFTVNDDDKFGSRRRSLSKSKKRRSSSIGETVSPKSYGFHDKRTKTPLKHSQKSSITSATKTKIIRDLQDVMLELQDLFGASTPNKVISTAYDLKKTNEQLFAFVGEVKDVVCRELSVENRNMEIIEVLNLVQKLIDETKAGKYYRTVLDRLSIALNIKSVDDLPKIITDILKETENLLLILNKVKSVFKLGNPYIDYRISLLDLEKEIDKRL